MDNWKRGDNAQCLKTISRVVTREDGTRFTAPPGTPRPEADNVYTVLGVRRHAGKDYLRFAEFPRQKWYDARYFRKIDLVQVDIFKLADAPKEFELC